MHGAPLEVYLLLIFYSDNINTTDSNGRTPAIITSVYKHRQHFWLLLQHGANMNYMSRHGESCITHVLANNWMSIVQEMVEKNKFNPAASVDGAGNTAAHKAAVEGRWRLLQWLLTKTQSRWHHKNHAGFTEIGRAHV